MADPLDPYGDLIAPLPPTAPLAGPAPLPSPVGQDPKSKLALIAALGAAIAGGRQSGMGGLLQGVQTAQQQQDQENLRRYQLGEQERQRNNQLLYEQQTHAQTLEDRRQQSVQSLLSDFQKRMPTFKDQSEYDQQLGMMSNALRGMVGSRLNDQVLRARYPYVAPKIDAQANKALDAWLSLPSNKKLLEENPEAAAKAVVLFDRDGDGEPERTSLVQLAELAKRPFASTQEGLIPAPKGSSKEDAANADAIYRDLHKAAIAGGKVDSPELRNKLRLQANEQYKTSTKTPDPLLDEMRRARIEEMKRRQNSPDMPPAKFNMANRLSDDFARDSKDFIQRAQSYGTVIAAAKDPSAAGDISLIFAYMKMLDPGSVVREGEFATAQNATGVPSRILNLYNNVVSGERLNPSQRADFQAQARKIYGAAKQRQDSIVRTYTGRAKTAQVPPELVIMDYGQTIEPDTPQVNPLDSAKQKLGIK